MSQQLFLIIYVIFAVFFTILFVMGRRSIVKNGTKLKASSPDSKAKPTLKMIGETVGDLHSEQMKSLNVIFVYNGHTWDAHEVLGATPGGSLEEIKKAFEICLQQNSPDSHEFFKLALTAILQHLKNQSLQEEKEAASSSHKKIKS